MGDIWKGIKMITKTIFNINDNYLVSRTDPFYKKNIYFIRTKIDGKYIDIELNLAETEDIFTNKDFEKVIRSSSKRHQYDYDNLLKDVVSSYVICEYGFLTQGINKIVQDLVKYPYIAEEFYRNVICKGIVPIDGIRVKGYTAYELQQENKLNDIQAYTALVRIIKDIKAAPKSEVKPKKSKLIADETLVMENFEIWKVQDQKQQIYHKQ